MRDPLKGSLAAFIAYLIWGAMPVYWRELRHIDSLEIICHRMVWSFSFMAIFVAVKGMLPDIVKNLKSVKGLLATLLASGALISLNWYLYVWAVNMDMILSVSLGYFINPLFSVFLGVLLFKERLRPVQWIAIAVTASGVCVEIAVLRGIPFISLAIPTTFALYGAIRKKVPIDPAGGLFVETAAAAPLALILLLRGQYTGMSDFPYSAWTVALLVGSGVLSSVALLLFAWGAKRIKLSTLGLIQYTSPIMTFIIAVFVYGEDLPLFKFLSFALIWIGIFIFTADSIRVQKAVEAEY